MRLEPGSALRPEGEIAGSSVPPFARRLADVIEDGLHVIVDLSGTTRLDAAAVRALVAADKTARALGRHFVLRGVDGQCARALTETGLDDRLEIARQRAA